MVFIFIERTITKNEYPLIKKASVLQTLPEMKNGMITVFLSVSKGDSKSASICLSLAVWLMCSGRGAHVGLTTPSFALAYFSLARSDAIWLLLACQIQIASRAWIILFKVRALFFRF
jgi:hypothetical protein